MSNSTILITGASGHLGRLVLEQLAEAGELSNRKVIATTRSPHKLAPFHARGVEVRAADFDDEAGLVKAFSGADRALLISTDHIDDAGTRGKQHQRAVRALVAAGVKHVVYTSLTNADKSKVALAPDHASTEAALADSKLGYTVLRNNVYAEMLLSSLPGAVATGQLIDARGNGKVSYITREDCARVAAAALIDDARSGREILEVSGPEALGSEDVAKLAGEITGRRIKHISVPVVAVVQGMVQHGLPESAAKIFASFDTAISAGEFGHPTDVVAKLTGHPPKPLRDFLAAHRSQLSPA